MSGHGELTLAVATAAGVYGWVILADDYYDGPIPDMIGPATITSTLRSQLEQGYGEHFRMGEPGEHGEHIYNEGRYLGPPHLRHTPLTEYGFAWSGATFIDYEIDGRWVRLRNPWAPTLRTRWRHRRYWLSRRWASFRRVTASRWRARPQSEPHTNSKGSRV
jgi:hypothetical protein